MNSYFFDLWIVSSVYIISFSIVSQLDGSISIVLEQVYNGPELNLGRNRHACGIIQNDDKMLVVVVGGYIAGDSDYRTRSVEFLDITNGLSENSEQRYIPNII